jgi:ubiquinone/menaquinone biosynthesis C-methylase UbiE
MSFIQKIHGSAHDKAVFHRRIEVLAHNLASLLPQNAKVLDIGCGSGTLALAILSIRPDITIEGIDVLVRPNTDIPVREFDGYSIPSPDKAYDIAMIVDVLHHTDDPKRLMAEAKRVAKQTVIKDHFRDGLLANDTLRFMDWFGNAAHGVRLPYNYLSKSEWLANWSDLGLTVDRLVESLGLYPAPFTWLFDRKLHFVARLG